MAEQGTRYSVRKELRASLTVEAAGVMSVVLFSLMILLGQAFDLRAETVGEFQLHLEADQARHLIENAGETEIIRSSGGTGWSLEIAASVFRPEKSLRMWSLAEDIP
ncbi:MAG: hypothetical protein Q4C73_01520 [Eubacteriales bacterium]|nr:hypothetical protein [Eubacteriales bacterium]